MWIATLAKGLTQQVVRRGSARRRAGPADRGTNVEQACTRTCVSRILTRSQQQAEPDTHALVYTQPCEKFNRCLLNAYPQHSLKK